MTHLSCRLPKHSTCRPLLPITLLALLVASFTVPTAQAQNLAQVYKITPEQGAESGLEAALQEHANWREENGDPWQWEVYQVVQGDNYGTYVLRSSNHTWKDFDRYRQGFGPKGFQHYQATVAPMVASTKAYIAETDTSHTHWPEDPSGYTLFEVTSYRLKPGHGEEFFEAHETFFKAVTQETEDRYIGTIDVVNGAEDDYVRLVFPHEEWADFKSPERSVSDIVEEVHGEEKAQELFDQFTNSFRSYYDEVARYRPDLSVQAQE